MHETTGLQHVRAASKQEEFLDGLRAGLPLVVGLIPFALAYGILAKQVGLTLAETVSMSVLVFAGAAQFIAVKMYGAGAAAGLIIITVFLINLRHLLMGAHLAPYLKRLPLWKQGLLAFGMTDESYVLTAARFAASNPSPWFQAGASASVFIPWVLISGLGAGLGNFIANPLSWGLDFAMTATFIVLLVPQLKDARTLAVAGLAGLTALAGAIYLPGKWYIIAAALAGTLAGGVSEELCARK